MRLVIVSNRLPYTVSEKEGSFVFEKSTGGLATGLGSYLDTLKKNPEGDEHVWIGWPGMDVPEERKADITRISREKYKCHPVYISEKQMEEFYEGFCNKTIWPLFHYFPLLTTYDEKYWKSYQDINEVFCNAVMEVISSDDVLWIHDYHLMLLPGLIRERMPNAKIGFFLHIPFPTYEIYRLLPRTWRREILEGLLGADLIGVHTQDYTQYFLRCVMRILGLDHSIGKIYNTERTVRADTFPMGIEYKKFCNATGEPATIREKEDLKKAFVNRKVILSIDRLDYSKGITNRLAGYEKFLENNPSWHKKTILCLNLVPSRTGVEQYQQMKRQIDEYIGRINGKFGSPDWTPISYSYSALTPESLSALYSISDVALVTPLRDGMNLIAKEYIASREKEKGVLILSEMAGASKELGEAIIINPNHKEEIALAIKEALEMPTEEQIKRNRAMQERLQRYNVIHWAEDFLSELSLTKEEQCKFESCLLSESVRQTQIEEYLKASRRLLLLDYDGVLAPFSTDPQQAKPAEDVIALLRRLTSDPRNTVAIISGRDRKTLTEWFGKLDIGLVAEHGAFIREKTGEWTTARPLNTEWKPKVCTVLRRYIDRVPGSFIEEKEYSLAWHYRSADPEFASQRAKELTDNLLALTATIELQVLQGNKVVEVRTAGINKGSAALHFQGQERYDYIMAIGDDWTDEDMFKALPKTACTIKVGMNPSYSRYNLHNYREAQKLLMAMAER
ncbi:MAG: bifunctional alpha,alpha-trehalose-phosphate synthase (UDP-forming)/trehalose-phosphatase [Candidatus Altiarchaeia archaeon]